MACHGPWNLAINMQKNVRVGEGRTCFGVSGQGLLRFAQIDFVSKDQVSGARHQTLWHGIEQEDKVRGVDDTANWIVHESDVDLGSLFSRALSCRFSHFSPSPKHTLQRLIGLLKGAPQRQRGQSAYRTFHQHSYHNDLLRGDVVEARIIIGDVWRAGADLGRCLQLHQRSLDAWRRNAAVDDRTRSRSREDVEHVWLRRMSVAFARCRRVLGHRGRTRNRCTIASLVTRESNH